MFDVSIFIAFGAGLASFFAPCVVPLLPAYIGYVTGVSLKELKERGISPFRQKMIITSILYILGFSLVFVAMGTAAASAGQVFRRYDYLIQRAGGFLILVFGLEFAGVFHLPLLNKTRLIQLPSWVNRLGHLRAFFVGLVFATAWTPCVGAVLGSILALAAVTATAVEGALLLFVYSLGISIPFLAVSLTLASAPKYLKFINKKVGIISRVAGIILVILGVLLLTNTYKYLNSWLFEMALKLGYKIR